MIFETIIEAVPILKKFTKQKFTGLQVLIFIGVFAVVLSLYELHQGQITSDSNMKINKEANTIQVQSIITDVSALKLDVNTLKTDVTIVKNDVGEVKSDVKDIKSTLYKGAFIAPEKDSTNSLVTAGR